MAKDPAALLYIDKWIVATTEMKADCRAYYMDMILFQFDKGSLPNDIEEIANICRVRISEFKSFEHVFEHVLKSKFKLNSEGRLENEFAKEIIQGRQQFLDKRSSSGRMSYFIRFIIKNFKPKKDVIQFVKDNADLSDIDLKNEQLLKHLFEHLLELYINVNEDEDKDVIDTKKGGTGGKRFIPPTFEEVKSYCEERRNNIDPQKFIDHYTARDWKPKGYTQKMKDWKAAIRTWENNNSNNNGTGKQQQLGINTNSGVSDDYKRDVLNRLGVT